MFGNRPRAIRDNHEFDPFKIDSGDRGTRLSGATPTNRNCQSSALKTIFIDFR